MPRFSRIVLIPALLVLVGCNTAAPPAAPASHASHADHFGHDTVEVQTLLQTTQSWDGETLPAYGDGQPQVTILRITIPAGVALPEHKHPVINAGVLLQGTLTVSTEDGDQTTLNAGDALAEVVHEWHHGANPGPDPAVILVVYAGTEGTPLTVLQDKP